MFNETKRDIVENILLDRFEQVQPYSPNYSEVIGKYKDGSFGVSNLAFALYSNGLGPRGRSSKHPYGLVFEDSETLFSIGYYRKENDPEDSDGYLFVVAPRGKNIGEKIGEIFDEVKGKDIPCKGVYARFLKLDQYLELLNTGFLPIEESPWHSESPKEDETYSHSIVNIKNHIPIKTRYAKNRFKNFLKRSGFQYELEKLANKEDARQVIDSHFDMLQKKGKAIGSTPEDHYNSLSSDLLNLESVNAYVGYLQEDPVSVFVGEMLSPNRFGLYTPFTLRDPDKISCVDTCSDYTGFTAMPTYAYVRLSEKLKERGISEVHLGGSELPDLDRFKRQLGGREDPSYWAVK